ncbi:MAG: phage tail protein [Planktothrix agardhii KL2]|jgi:hypothetical protein|uniref:Uncharacterized protein n=1 Tax=Planktothrix agardhii (strain NIVA-CYA 126/8) TaxID=388467 RepID=A0A073CEZ0_PLAA1|nr:hypothetical protein [Planktothrix agardhii]KEI66834.1 hypothetical protein A19Y_1846 [Planktothrix agardhii NIVA-CYA 126/8]MBG0749215.1 phage tail protein [Planktothrix agardhii KL2]MCF3624714.1 phage tail protein [Planktothrix agardhii 1801]CAD5915847.1 hypothetical protein NO365_00333 [Planktothrix agardhii]CAD5962375.1 hypothetical protein NIVACYA_03715 [Planktothrix agardhii]
MITFGLITEGLTDQIVIENILHGYFNTEPVVNPLQPERDKDNDDKSDYGGWTLVFKYFQERASDFQQAFQYLDYVIIHIDTDRSQDKNYDIPHQDEKGVKLTPEQLIEKVKEKFKSLIGEPFYSDYSRRIIFAIAVDSTECWLLPLYCNKKAHKQKIVHCLDTLNSAINKKKGFTIDNNAKNPDYYRTLSKPYSKHKTFIKNYPNNPSFNSFIKEIETKIETKNIVIDSDD